MGAMDHKAQAAVRGGWSPTPATDLRTFKCESGCGRSITTDKRDGICGYLCLPCREEIRQHHASQTRRKRVAVRLSGGIAGPTTKAT